MILNNQRMYSLPKWSLLLVVLSLTAVASAGEPPKKSAPSHSSNSSRPAQHSAPAQHGGPSGHASAGARAPSGGHAASSGRPASGGGRSAPTQRGEATSHAPSGGRTAGNAHTPMGGHASPGGHTAMPGHATAGGHAPEGGRAATGGRMGAGGHTPAGTRNVSLRGGGSASLRKNGQIRSVDRNGMHIDHGVRGGRTVVGMRNGARVVNTGRNGGFVQRSYVNRGGHSYYSRTYYSHGSYHVAVYRGYNWHGHAYYGYRPGYWYHPGFYAWGYRPWGSPVYFGVGLWGWGGAPWYGFYGGWFTPYPYYPSPAFWLTDYVVAAELQSAYAARADANADAAANYDDGGGNAPPQASGAATLTPEVKQAIAEEVKAQLAAQESQAGQDGGSGGQATPGPANNNEEVPPALDPARRTFVVDNNLTVVANGQECALSAGDVITRLTDTPDADNTVNASVSASKQSECAAGETVAVKVDDLQEMQNHFAEQLNNGLGELAKKQGTGGIPKAPDTSTVASDIPAPEPDKTAEKTLQEQQEAADQAEAQVKQEAASGGGQ